MKKLIERLKKRLSNDIYRLVFFWLFLSKIGIWSVGFGKRGKLEVIKKE